MKVVRPLLYVGLTSSFLLHVFFLAKPIQAVPSLSKDPFFSGQGMEQKNICPPLAVEICPACIKKNVSSTSTYFIPPILDVEALDCAQAEALWYARTLAMLEEECETTNNDDACSKLGFLYLKEPAHHSISNTERAWFLLQQHCKGTCASKVAAMYEEGQQGLAKNLSKAFSWYQKGCQESDLTACRSLFHLYRKEAGAFTDPEKEKQYERATCLTQEIQLSDPEACEALSKKYIQTTQPSSLPSASSFNQGRP